MMIFGDFLQTFSFVDILAGSSLCQCRYILNYENEISPFLCSYIPETKMLKIDYASMIGRHFQQLIDHNFGWRVPTLVVTLLPVM